MAATPADFLKEDGSWQCTQCGACCLYAQPVLKDPWMDRGDGGCVHLKDTMQCGIYESRPVCCNTYEYEPEGTDQQRAVSCAWLKNKMDAEIAAGERSAEGDRRRV